MPSRRNAAVFFTNYFLLFASFAILAPYLQLYLKARGFSPSRIGLLLGILELAGITGPILLSRLADSRTAYRSLLAAALVVSVASFVPLQLTTLFPVYVFCLALMGFSYRSTAPLLDSAMSRVLPDPRRQYGRFRVAGSIGFIVVSLLLLLGGFVSSNAPFSILAAFGVSSLLASGAALLLPAVPKMPPHPRAGTPERTSGVFGRGFWVIIGVVFLGRFGMGAYYSFFSLYLRDTFAPTYPADSGGSSVVSMMWALGSIAEIATMWFSGRLIRRWGLRTMLIVSLAAITVRLGLFVLEPSLLVIAGAQLLHALTFGTFHTAAVAYVNARIPAERRGLGMAIYNAIGIGLASFLASLAGGYILEARGYSALFLSSAAVPLGGIAILTAFGRRLLPRVPANAG
jgi:MFS transporter, PPP family, 3-phenylpropionic acid transporter